jgi:hypothetical protein
LPVSAEVGIDAIEGRADEIGLHIRAIRDDYADIRRRVAGAREVAKYMFDNPDHHTTSDVEEKAEKILEWLEGI